jgi:transketolase
LDRQLPEGMATLEHAASLRKTSQNIRRSVAEMIEHARLGHFGDDFSVSDILATLYFSVLRVDLKQSRRRRRRWMKEASGL